MGGQVKRQKRLSKLAPVSGLDAGIHLLAKAVAVTYGPKGGTVALQRAGGPLWTRDGATVAWELSPANPLVRMGVRLAQTTCDRVSKTVGDGTTTTAILLDALLRQVRKEIAGGADPWQVARRLQGHDWRSLVEPWAMEANEDLLHAVALSASHGDTQIAQALLQAQDLTGSRGLVVVEEGTSRTVEVLAKPGFILEHGWESLEMAGADGGPRVLEGVLVALVDGELSKMEDVTSMLEEATAFPHPLLIISRGIFGQALQTLVANDRKLTREVGPNLEVGACRPPSRGRHAWFRDLAALTGATVVRDWRKFNPAWFGGLRKAELQREKTILTANEDATDRLEEHLAAIAVEEGEASSTWEAEECRRRAAMLSGGLCVLRVGGHSPSEIKERKGRVEDALLAVQSAARSGVLPQGIWSQLATVEPAFWAPIDRVLANAGFSRLVVYGHGGSPWEAFDASLGQWVDAAGQGLVVPVDLVVKVAEIVCSVVSELGLSALVIRKYLPYPTR